MTTRVGGRTFGFRHNLLRRRGSRYGSARLHPRCTALLNLYDVLQIHRRVRERKKKTKQKDKRGLVEKVSQPDGQHAAFVCMNNKLRAAPSEDGRISRREKKKKKEKAEKEKKPKRLADVLAQTQISKLLLHKAEALGGNLYLIHCNK